MDSDDTQRLLGKLEEATDTLKGTVPSILKAIETSRVERGDWETKHTEEDRGQFARIHDSLGSLTHLREMVEGHGRALLNMEMRINDVEVKATIASAKADTARQVNARWSRGLLSGAAAVGAVAGTAGTTAGPKVWKALISFLKAL